MTKKQKIGIIIGTSLSVLGITTAITIPVIVLTKNNIINITKEMSQNIYDSVVNDISIGKMSLEQLNSIENVNKLKEKIANQLNIDVNNILNIVFLETNNINMANFIITFADNIKISIENDDLCFEQNKNNITSKKPFYYGIPPQNISIEVENAFDDAISQYIQTKKDEQFNTILLNSINETKNINELIVILNQILTKSNSTVKVINVLFLVNDVTNGIYASISFDGIVEPSDKSKYVHGENFNTLISKKIFFVNIYTENNTNKYLNMIDSFEIGKILGTYGKNIQEVIETLSNRETLINFISNNFPIGDRQFVASIKLDPNNKDKIEFTIYFVGSSEFMQIAIYPSFGNKIDGNFIINGGVLVGLTEMGKQQTTLDLSSLNIYAINESTFYQNKILTSIKIPNTITTISNNAFDRCFKLSEVTFEDNSQLATIGNSAFSNCVSLTKITIPKNTTSIDNSAFSGCSSLESISIPNTVSTIGNNAFSNCISLKSITIPNSVSNIEDNAFSGCSNLSNVIFEPNSHLVSIGINAFTNPIEISLNNCTLIDNEKFTNISINNPNVTFIKENCSIDNNDVLNLNQVNLSSSKYYDNITNTLKIPSNIKFLTGSISNNLKTRLRSVEFEPNSQLNTIDNKAFYNCSSLISINIPNSVTCIKDSAFSGCLSLASINIPNSVTLIDKNAFNNCSNLVTVTFENNSKLNSIGEGAFINCRSLTTFNVPSSVTSIKNNVFNNCLKLSTITFEANSKLNSIGEGAFINCELLNMVDLNSCNLLTINQYIDICNNNSLTKFINNKYDPQIFNLGFEGVSGSTLTIPSKIKYLVGRAPKNINSVNFNGNTSITSIPNYAFQNCNQLISINIPNSVTSIGFKAFSNCYELVSVTFDSNSQLNLIDNSAFISCTSLTSINIPNTVNFIGDNAFNNCSKLSALTFETNSQLNLIGNSAFSSCISLVSINIPSSIITIANNAFNNCSKLTSVIFESNNKLNSIGNNAFYNCTLLTTLDLNSCNLLTIDQYINICINNPLINFINNKYDSLVFNLGFEGVSGSTLTIPSKIKYLVGRAPKNINSVNFNGNTSITSIPNYAFQNCTSLDSINIPNNIKTIGINAFYNSGLSSITFESNSQLNSIGDNAFGSCKNLSYINIPNGVTAINDCTFDRCTSLSSINIPSSVISIGDNAFNYCNRLTNISFESNSQLNLIGNNAFANCSNLTTFNIPNNVTIIKDSAFYYCSSLTTINIPNNVVSIGESVFFDCNKLSTVSFEPNSQLKSIGDYAFGNCSLLWTLTIPNSVTLIGSSAFYGCKSLNTITFNENSKLQMIEKNAFETTCITKIDLSNCKHINLLQRTKIEQGNPNITFTFSY